LLTLWRGGENNAMAIQLCVVIALVEFWLWSGLLSLRSVRWHARVWLSSVILHPLNLIHQRQQSREVRLVLWIWHRWVLVCEVNVTVELDFPVSIIWPTWVWLQSAETKHKQENNKESELSWNSPFKSQILYSVDVNLVSNNYESGRFSAEEYCRRVWVLYGRVMLVWRTRELTITSDENLSRPHKSALTERGQESAGGGWGEALCDN
jgi:hypothetical protein